jgi:hypothetical protein
MRLSIHRNSARGALTLLTITVATVAGVFASGSPLASAATPAATTRAAQALLTTTRAQPAQVVGSSAASTKAPNSNVEKKATEKVFVPKFLVASWSGSTEKKCTAAKQSVTITNVTPKAVTVTYEGQMLVKLRPNFQFGACFWGTGVGRFVFGLGKSAATLKVHVR